MSSAAQGKSLTVGLLGACTVLGAVVGLELRYPQRLELPPVIPAPAAPAEPPVRLTYSAPPLQAYDEILLRPLFAKDRQPPPEPDATEQGADSAASDDLGAWKLEGVVVTPERRLALLRDSGSGKFRRLSQGEELAGWQVSQVQADRVVLKQEQEQHEILLQVAKGGSRPPALPATPQGMPVPPAILLQRQALERRRAAAAARSRMVRPPAPQRTPPNPPD